MTQIIDGKKISQEIKDELREQVAEQKKLGKEAALAVIQVGTDPASSVYVNNKKKACAYIGIGSLSYELPEETTEEELLALVEKLNGDASVNGILVQLPLPEGLDSRAVLEAIRPEKDVDAFHPENVGRLMLGLPRFLPCTPAGVMALLRAYGISPAGKHCVVIGRSNIVGKPMALLLLAEDATVTVCHSRTPDLAEQCRRADILISAVGRRGLITADMVKPGAAVIDVGMNRDENGGCGYEPQRGGQALRRRGLRRRSGKGVLYHSRAGGGWPYDTGHAHGKYHLCIPQTAA